MTRTYAPYKRPSQKKIPTQTESEGLETNITSKWTGEKSYGRKTLIRQLRLQKKDYKKRPRRHFIVFKGRIHQEDINIVNIYVANIAAPKYINLGGLQERLTATQL